MDALDVEHLYSRTYRLPRY